MFRKKKDVAISESWSLFKLTHNDKEYLVRCNVWLWNIVAHKNYPFKVGIAIPLKSSEFPTPEENTKIAKIEEKIVTLMESNSKSIFVGSITGKGLKEFVLYTSDPSDVETKFNQIKKKINDWNLQISFSKDENWEVFRSICPQHASTN